MRALGLSPLPVISLMLLSCRERTPWDWVTALSLDALTVLWVAFLLGLL